MKAARSDIDYRCSGCGKFTDRELLTVRKVSFMEMGEKAKTLRARTEHWLCPDCVKKDPVYNLPQGYSPGRD